METTRPHLSKYRSHNCVIVFLLRLFNNTSEADPWGHEIAKYVNMHCTITSAEGGYIKSKTCYNFVLFLSDVCYYASLLNVYITSDEMADLNVVCLSK